MQYQAGPQKVKLDIAIPLMRFASFKFPDTCHAPYRFSRFQLVPSTSIPFVLFIIQYPLPFTFLWFGSGWFFISWISCDVWTDSTLVDGFFFSSCSSIGSGSGPKADRRFRLVEISRHGLMAIDATCGCVSRSSIHHHHHHLHTTYLLFFLHPQSSHHG